MRSAGISGLAWAGHRTGLFEARGVRTGGDSGKTAVRLTNNLIPAREIGRTRVLLTNTGFSPPWVISAAISRLWEGGREPGPVGGSSGVLLTLRVRSVVRQVQNDRLQERWGGHSCLPRADRNVCPTCH